MNKFQNIKFSDFDDFLYYLPENERNIVNSIKELIQDCIPNCTEKLSYNVPYYYRHSRICFIWPSAVPWGKVKRNGVILGFCNGYLLNDHLNWLEKDGRKHVYSRTFMNVKEIPVEIVKTYLFEAVEIDERLKRKSTKTNHLT